MRCCCLAATLGIASFALLCLTPDPAQAQGRRSFCGPVYYPAGPVYYYYPPPMYPAPRVYPARPMFYHEPYTYRPSASMSSHARPNAFEPMNVPGVLFGSVVVPMPVAEIQ